VVAVAKRLGVEAVVADKPLGPRFSSDRRLRGEIVSERTGVSGGDEES